MNQSSVGADFLYDVEHTDRDYIAFIDMLTDLRYICPLRTLAANGDKLYFYSAVQHRINNKMTLAGDDIQAILGRYEPQEYTQRRYITTIQQLFYHLVSHEKLIYENHSMKINEEIYTDSRLSSRCKHYVDQKLIPKYAAVE